MKNRGCFVDSNSKLYGDHLLRSLHGLKEQQLVCVGRVCVRVRVCLHQHVYLFETKHEGSCSPPPSKKHMENTHVHTLAGYWVG